MNKAKRQILLLSLALFTAQWLLWSLWQNFALPALPSARFSVVLDSTVVKAAVWGLPWILVMVFARAAWYAPPRRLLRHPFPGLACVVLLCLTTVFLYTVRLLRGLVNTHTVFDPMFLVISIGAGVIEEFSFRAGLFNLQQPIMGFLPATLINALFFTLYHYPGLMNGDSISRIISWRGLLLFVMGGVFSWMYYKWKSLPLNMTVHAFWDILTYLFCLAG